MSETVKKSVSPAERTLFRTPFSPAYWKSAFSEVKSLRMLVIAAIIVAIRVALKNVRIPVGDSLNIYVGFIFASVGGSVYGPVMGFLAGIVSDLIGFVVAPSGAFNPIYTLIEAFSGLLYGLLMYRQKITFTRILMTKASVNLIINIICTSVANGIVMGKGVYYYMIPSILKNLVLLPFEVLVLVIVFTALIKPMLSMRMYAPAQNALVVKKSMYVVLAAVAVWGLVLVAAVVIVMNYPAAKATFKAFFDSIFQ